MKIKKKIEFYQKFIEKEIDIKITRVSKVYYEDDNGYVYPEQILASLMVIYNMILSIKDPTFSRYNILFAETQVGKTGTIGNIVFLLEYYEELRKYLKLEWDSSLVITPMSDVANKAQIKNDLVSQAFNRKDKKCLLSKDVVLHNPDMSSNLHKDDKNQLKNGIIFMDESHLASYEYSANNKFLKKNNILLNGFGNLEKNNSFLITISATPYEEFVGNLLYEMKNVVRIIPGKGYKGIEYFYKNGLIRESFKLTDIDGIKHFHEELKTFNYKHGYYLVRHGKVDIKRLVPKGFKYITYYEKDKIDINKDVLMVKPKYPTLIFIKEKMKQSFQLEKSNIVMLFDRSVKMSSINRTNFIVQSFIGRSTGYHNFNFFVYTDLLNIKSHLSFLSDYNNIPTNKHIVKKTFSAKKSTNLLKLDFNQHKVVFKTLLSLENKKSNKDEIVDIILSKFNVDILRKFKTDESIYNSNFFYSKSVNRTYDEYITQAYYDIEHFNGISNQKFLRKIEQYKNGDEVFAIYVDKDNFNIIVAYKYFSDINDENTKYIFKDKCESSYSNKNILCDILVDKRKNVATLSFEGFLKVNGSKVKVYFSRNDEMVLPKNSKVCLNNRSSYIKNYVVVKDISIPCKNNTEKREALTKLCYIISKEKKISDFKCLDKNRERKFIDVLGI